MIDEVAPHPPNNKCEIEDRLEIEINQFQDILSQVKFSKSNIHTPEIDAEIQGLCAAIIDFLVHALNYQKKRGIGTSNLSRPSLMS